MYRLEGEELKQWLAAEDKNNFILNSGKAVKNDILDLSEANLIGADLIGADLTGANLSWADLSWADLTGANLSGADITGADITRADIGDHIIRLYNFPEYHLYRINDEFVAGCKRHKISEWKDFTKKEILAMDGKKGADFFYKIMIHLLDL